MRLRSASAHLARQGIKDAIILRLHSNSLKSRNPESEYMPALEKHVIESRQEEAELIARIKNGQRELFYELIRPLERNLYRNALYRLRNEADAQEVVQEALLKAWGKLKSFRGEAKFSTWVMAITINEAYMRLRRTRKKLFESLETFSPGEEPGSARQICVDSHDLPSQLFERAETKAMLQAAISCLPDLYREVIVQRDLNQLSIAETAKVLHISQPLVKTRLFRARLRVRKLLCAQSRAPVEHPTF